jgi:putative endonuclease
VVKTLVLKNPSLSRIFSFLSFPRRRESSIILLMKNYFVYILANKRNGTLYIGVTNDLVRRMYEHNNSIVDGFTKKYNIKILVYYEMTENIMSAIEREKNLKRWNRKWKLDLIEKENPEWKDLTFDL